MDSFIKQQLPRWAKENLVKSVGKDMYQCPFCGSGTGKNATGGLKVYKEAFYCHKCQERGDIADLIKITHGCTPAESFKIAEQFAGVTPETRPTNQKMQAKTQRKLTVLEGKIMKEKITPDNTKFFEECQEHLRTEQQAIDYLCKRGIPLQEALSRGWGYNQKEHKIVIRKDNGIYEQRTILEYGIKTIKQTGFDGLIGAEVLYVKGKTTFIVEGPFDQVSVELCGHPAIALCGTNNYRFILDMLKEKPSDSILILALDNDEDGRDKTEKFAKELDLLGIKYHIPEGLYGECKDANELLVKDKDVLFNNLLKTQFDTIRKFDEAKQNYIRKYSAKNALLDLLCDIKECKGTPIKTGFFNFDDSTNGGIWPGLTTIGAAPSLGKTTWTLQAVDQMAKSGIDIMFFSLEMAPKKLIARSISRLSYQVSGNKEISFETNVVVNGECHKNFTDVQKNLFVDCVEEYHGYEDHIFFHHDLGKIGVDFIREKVEEHMKVIGTKPLIVIDYLQMLASPDNHLNDKQAVDINVLALKQLSSFHDLCIIAVSSFNRGSYESKVTMGNFKESGAIEYGSDVLMGLEFDFEQEFDNYNKPVPVNFRELKKREVRDMILQIIKNRDGEAEIGLKFDYVAKFNCFIPIGDIDKYSGKK